MKKLSWQESFGDNEEERRRNMELMLALQQRGIPYTITKEPGAREDEEFVLMIGDGLPGTIYVGAGYNGYFMDVLKMDNLIRGGVEDLDVFINKIKFLLIKK